MEKSSSSTVALHVPVVQSSMVPLAILVPLAHHVHEAFAENSCR